MVLPFQFAIRHRNYEVDRQLSDPVSVLAEQIRKAFEGNARLARQAFVYPDTWETEDLLRSLAKVGDVPNDRFVEWHFSSLPVFTAEGFREVLPQYMTYSLRHPRSDVTEYLIFHLSPAETNDHYWSGRLAVFSTAQRQVICAFVKHLEPLDAGCWISFP
jgi:hypothetical protein